MDNLGKRLGFVAATSLLLTVGCATQEVNCGYRPPCRMPSTRIVVEAPRLDSTVTTTTTKYFWTLPDATNYLTPGKGKKEDGP